MMSYQYLFCATCGQRRTGHSFRCSVCDTALRRLEPRRPSSLLQLQPLVRANVATDERQPIAA
jgi:hypothetical protein